MGCKLEFFNPPDLKWGNLYLGGSSGLFKMLHERKVDILACAQYQLAVSMKLMCAQLGTAEEGGDKCQFCTSKI